MPVCATGNMGMAGRQADLDSAAHVQQPSHMLPGMGWPAASRHATPHATCIACAQPPQPPTPADTHGTLPPPLLQGDSLLYMDPHQTQRLAQLPDDIATYFCDTMRLMPLTAIDPSMALGFYCR